MRECRVELLAVAPGGDCLKDLRIASADFSWHAVQNMNTHEVEQDHCIRGFQQNI